VAVVTIAATDTKTAATDTPASATDTLTAATNVFNTMGEHSIGERHEALPSGVKEETVMASDLDAVNKRADGDHVILDTPTAQIRGNSSKVAWVEAKTDNDAKRADGDHVFLDTPTAEFRGNLGTVAWVKTNTKNATKRADGDHVILDTPTAKFRGNLSTKARIEANPENGADTKVNGDSDADVGMMTNRLTILMI